MAIVTGDRYLEKLVKFVEEQAGPLIEGSVVLKLNPAGLHYVQSRLEALRELESLLAGAPVDYLRAYVSDLGDHRALEQLRRILRLLTSLKVVSVLPPPLRDPTPLSLLPFGRLRVLELRRCDLSTSAARGLLELRHTLEKIVCHNSTDALRHVFASRILDIKDSPQWNRLSFVSCACNGLVLMDESLQLLPVVETLDLSRNKFSKVDNLRRCSKLKHLDLGFNNLRTIASLSEVSCHLVKLVLRNNALTTLHGIENLKSLEGLDVSYNIISSFSEMELLAGIPSLRNLWMEGNPICCARWYRAHVFSFFSDLDKLKLDDKQISKREFWKRQIIIASRQKRPASFGFYSPAKDNAKAECCTNKNKKRVSRLASIESEEEDIYSSDLESLSYDNEVRGKEDITGSDNEAEIVDLINRIELMKKERSVFWLREFKDWMVHGSENLMEGSIYSEGNLHPGKYGPLKANISPRHLGQSSMYVLDSGHARVDGTSTTILESDSPLTDMSAGLHHRPLFSPTCFPANSVGPSLADWQSVDLNEAQKSHFHHKGVGSASFLAKCSHQLKFHAQECQRIFENYSVSPLSTMNERSESRSSSVGPGSPPHYQADILHRRHNLVEEILQLSAESYSVASSDSNTSSSEDGIFDAETSVSQADLSLDKRKQEPVVEGPSASLYFEKKYVQGQEVLFRRQNGQLLSSSLADGTSSSHKHVKLDYPADIDAKDLCADVCDEVDHTVKRESWWGKRESKRKAKRRVVPMLESYNAGKIESSHESSGDPSGGTDEQSLQGASNAVEVFFNSNIADSRVNETCKLYLHCNCVIDPESFREREVVLLLSSENKLYVLLPGTAADGSGSIFSLLCRHDVEDVGEIVVGLGLQVLRLRILMGTSYVFITRSLEKSRQLLCTLKLTDTSAFNDKCSLRSLEQVQVGLFEKHLFGGSKVSIYQYSLVLFWCNKYKEESWVSRSLFVIGRHILVCIEDLPQFGSSSMEASPRYFAHDSCCLIADVSEMVVEAKDTQCVTLAIECEFRRAAKGGGDSADVKQKTASNTLKWKLKWFVEDNLLNFVALVKAIHTETTASPLLVRCIS